MPKTLLSPTNTRLFFLALTLGLMTVAGHAFAPLLLAQEGDGPTHLDKFSEHEHGDASHLDIFSEHGDASHSDVFSEHGDASHIDIYSAHGDASHSDVFSEHGDASHLDIFSAHGEASHSDVFSAHGEASHSDVFSEHMEAATEVNGIIDRFLEAAS